MDSFQVISQNMFCNLAKISHLAGLLTQLHLLNMVLTVGDVLKL